MSTGKKIRAILATLIGTGMIAFSAHAKNSLFIVINDHLGTPQMLIDEHKNIVWHAEYDEFGKADILVEKTEFNLRFPGQYYDKETGLHYNYYRDYDPALGRYRESDPIGLAGGINTYAYVDSNPITGFDPSGLANSGWQPSSSLKKVKSPPDPIKTLSDAYDEMKNKNVPGSDQFFHCMATCRAKKNGSTVPVIRSYTDTKEASDYIRNFFGMYGRRDKLPHKEMMDDIKSDQAVNDHGMSCPDNESCAQRCKPYLDALAAKNKTHMKEYLPK